MPQSQIVELCMWSIWLPTIPLLASYGDIVHTHILYFCFRERWLDSSALIHMIDFPFIFSSPLVGTLKRRMDFRLGENNKHRTADARFVYTMFKVLCARAAPNTSKKSYKYKWKHGIRRCLFLPFSPSIHCGADKSRDRCVLSSVQPIDEKLPSWAQNGEKDDELNDQTACNGRLQDKFLFYLWVIYEKRNRLACDVMEVSVHTHRIQSKINQFQMQMNVSGALAAWTDVNEWTGEKRVTEFELSQTISA